MKIDPFTISVNSNEIQEVVDNLRFITPYGVMYEWIN
jgi:hypothetical protein